MGRPVLEVMLDYLSGPDIIQIMDKETGLELYKGFKGLIHKDGTDFLTVNGIKPVKEYCASCEIVCKDWKEKGLIGPMMPEALPQYSFKDMQVSIIHKFWV